MNSNGMHHIVVCLPKSSRESVLACIMIDLAFGFAQSSLNIRCDFQNVGPAKDGDSGDTFDKTKATTCFQNSFVRSPTALRDDVPSEFKKHIELNNAPRTQRNSELSECTQKTRRCSRTVPFRRPKNSRLLLSCTQFQTYMYPSPSGQPTTVPMTSTVIAPPVSIAATPAASYTVVTSTIPGEAVRVHAYACVCAP
jgi:hypothetical protein